MSKQAARNVVAVYLWCCNRVLINRKNTGTKNIASTVAVIMPPTTPVPMAFWLPAPAPCASASGVIGIAENPDDVDLLGIRATIMGKFVDGYIAIGAYHEPALNLAKETNELLRRLAEREPPALVVDLHARGDNQFNFPVAVNADLARALAQGYR